MGDRGNGMAARGRGSGHLLRKLRDGRVGIGSISAREVAVRVHRSRRCPFWCTTDSFVISGGFYREEQKCNCTSGESGIRALKA